MRRRDRIKKTLIVGAVAGLVLALLPAPAPVEPSAWARSTDHALSLRVRGDITESQIVEDPFTIVGVTWEGPSPTEISVRTRTQGRWSPWRTIQTEDDHGPDTGTAEFRHQRHGTQPVWAGESDAVQFRLRGGAPRQATVTLVDTTNRTKPLFMRLAERFSPKPADAAVPQPQIHPRSDWDPSGSCVPKVPPSYVQVTVAFVHHTAGWNTYTQAEVPSYILGICLYHVNTRGWNDIAYNALVDRFGGVWEGRAGGIDKGVQGAHTQGFNSYSTGIALLGSFQGTGVSPSTAMQDSLVDLLAWKFSIHNIDPKGTTTVVSKGSSKYAQGTSVTLNTISGHRDAQATSCPGDSCYVLLPSFRDRVAVLWQPIPLDAYTNPLVGDFNGDGTEDGAVFHPADGTWWVTDGSSGNVGSWGSLSPTTGWDTHLVGDFNGDGKDDLASYQNGTWTTSLSTGTSFTPTTWGSLSPTTGWDTHLVGDFNGDGRDDLASYRSDNGTWMTLLATGTTATTGPSAVTSSADHFSLALSFDANGDGSDDIIQLDAYDGSWHAGFIDADRLEFSVLEDAPYRTTLARSPRRSRGDGQFLTYFGQEFRWIRTETGYGLSSVGSVTRLWGEDRYATAAAVSASGFPAGASQVYVATGENFPDALAAVPAAFHEGAPIVLTRTGSLPSATRTELQRLAPDRIIVLGGPGAVSDLVMDELDSLAPNGAVRRAGPTRYETAVETSRAVFDPGVPVVYITSGFEWPEAVAAGPPAGFLGGPLLLVLPDGIPKAVRDELSRLRPTRIVIVGPQTHVSTTVESQLAVYTSAGVTRITASDRYAMAAAVSADAFSAGISRAFVATGLVYPDGLTGGALAALHGAPLLLTDPETLPAPTEQELLRLRPSSVTIFGGEGAVSPGVASDLARFQALSALTSDLDPLPHP
ncbi:MAG: hypothetical protein GWP04_00890 [Gammaproteobacteria bacterium]|nr:hypothetical protein [Gammaproteobacteria bacterium]